MFYNYELLCTRAGGKFALIWLGATHKKLSFNEIMKVNVHNSCNDIIEVVKMSVAQSLPDKVRPRFSLYLSSMLMYGTCVILRRQCVIVMDQMMTWSRMILTLTTVTKVPTMYQEADDAQKKKGRKRKRNLSVNDESSTSNKSRLDIIPAVTEQNAIPCNSSEIDPNKSVQLNKISAVLTSPDILQHTECNIQMLDASISELHDEIENILRIQERQIGNECMEDFNFKIPMISSPTNITTVEIHNIGIEFAESAAIDKDNIDAIENVQQVNLTETGVDLNKEMQIEERYSLTELGPLPVLKQPTSSENVEVNVNNNEQMQDGQISSTVMLAPNQLQTEEPETSKNVQSKQHLPKPAKRRKPLILVDEETQVSKDQLRGATYILDLELRTKDLGKELITTEEKKSFSYFQNLFSFSCANDLTKFFSEQRIKYDSTNLHQTRLDSEIERGQKTPTGSPMDALKMGRGSEILGETTVSTSKLHSISESNLEIQDVPLHHPTPEPATKLSEDTTLIPAEIAPVSLVEDQTFTENVQGEVIDDSKVIPETQSSKENTKGDEKLSPEQQYDKSLTALQISPERDSNARKLRAKILKTLKKLLSLKNKVISFQDLCPHHSCTKYEVAITFKYLLELHMRKKIVLHQDRNIPHDVIHIEIK